tara:strand:- start:5591 stop:6484 length:894 start_codon:yes stop_codon:yes gene_type:complete
MDRIIIFGSTGHIGSKLYASLSNKQTIYTSSREGIDKNDNFIKLDLIDKSAVNNFVDKYDRFNVVIFLVGLAHKKGSNKDFLVHEKINFLTLKNLFSSFKSFNKIPDKIIFASTVSVYGEKINNKEYLEHHSLYPRSPYALTKLKAEQYLLKNFISETWILRLAPVYSNDFLLNIDRRTQFKKLFFRVSSGKNKLSLCNVKNIEDCIISIINDVVPSSVYNLADKKTYTYNDLLSFRNPKTILYIPSFLILFFYRIGLLFGNVFLIENSIKLLSDNIFSSNKIQRYIQLNHRLGKNR